MSMYAALGIWDMQAGDWQEQQRSLNEQVVPTALQQVGGSSIKVALSQLVGGIVASGNSLQCFDNYDENLAAVNCRSGASK